MTQYLVITPQNLIQQLKLSGEIAKLVDDFINQKIIQETAVELGIKNSVNELQSAVDEFRLMNKLHNAQDTWEWLSQQSLSLEDLEAIVNQNLIVMKLGKHLFENKIQEHFIEDKLDYTGVILYEVVLDDQEMAMELYLAIDNQEINFHAVAHQYNKDVEMRRQGGYRGVLYRQDLKPEISASVFSSNPPELLKPIITSRGISLIYVEEIIQPQLTEDIGIQIGVNLFNQWLGNQKKELQYKFVDS